MSKIITEQVFSIYSSDPSETFWYQIEDEQVVGCGAGIRISYRESGRELAEADYIDIVGTPEMIREIGLAITQKATELLRRSNMKKISNLSKT